MAGQQHQFVVRLPFWHIWLRWTVAIQVLLFTLLLAFWAGRFAFTGEWQVRGDEAVGIGPGFVLNAVGGLVVAGVGQWYGGAVLTAEGIRPVYPTGNRDRVFPWAEVRQLRRWNGGLRGRWIVITPAVGLPFKLPTRPADPIGFREAVERFAGPEHPLAVALSESAEVP